MNRSQILMINQNQIEARFLVAQLGSRNIDVLLANNTRQAFSQIMRELPDAILMASIGKEGFSFCHMIRQYIELPIIVICDNHQNNEELEYLEAGADDYLVKPFSLDVLSLKLKASIRRCGSCNLPASRQKETNMV